MPHFRNSLSLNISIRHAYKNRVTRQRSTVQKTGSSLLLVGTRSWVKSGMTADQIVFSPYPRHSQFHHSERGPFLVCTPRRRWSRRHPSREGIKELLKALRYPRSLLGIFAFPFSILYSLNKCSDQERLFRKRPIPSFRQSSWSESQC